MFLKNDTIIMWLVTFRNCQLPIFPRQLYIWNNMEYMFNTLFRYHSITPSDTRLSLPKPLRVGTFLVLAQYSLGVKCYPIYRPGANY